MMYGQADTKDLEQFILEKLKAFRPERPREWATHRVRWGLPFEWKEPK